jgi:hypothetical protein
MKIQVEDKLFIESDGMQFILKQYSEKPDKNGNETYKVLGYFSTLKQVVKYLIKKDCMESTVTTFQQLFNELDRIENKYDNLIKI